MWRLEPLFLPLMIATLLILAIPHAFPRDLGQWDNSSELSQWYKSVRMPDQPNTSCCGEADAYYADEYVVEGDKVFAIITDDREVVGRRPIPKGTRFEIPPHKIQPKYGNPTGHTIIFIGNMDQVFCFIMNGGV